MKVIFSFTILAVLFISACKTTRRVPDGQLLLQKNVITVDKSNEIQVSDLEMVLKQKPNRKIFGTIPFHLFMYNLPSPAKTEKKAAIKRAKQEKKNIATQAKVDSISRELIDLYNELKTANAKDSLRIIKRVNYLDDRRVYLEDKIEEPKTTFREWLRYTVGEEPVLIDTFKIKTSVNNLHSYLFKKGFLYNEVSDSIAIDSSSMKRATVYYKVVLNAPYILDSFRLEIDDKKLKRQIENNMNESLIKLGNNLDYETLDKERDRITLDLRNRGYHFFNKDFIYFDVDTSRSSHKVDLILGVKNIYRPLPNYPDSLVETYHKRYLIADIFVNTDFDPLLVNDPSYANIYDTIYNENTHEHYIIYNRERGLLFTPKVLLQSIFINRAYIYRAKEVEATFKKLGSLGVFKTINIQFVINDKDPTGTSLNCFINLQPNKRQSISTESNGTNRGGNLGISGNITYKNKNLFRGAELLRVTLSGGIEAQQVLANEDQGVINGDGAFKALNTFNTLEFGPEISLFFPKFLVPFNVVKLEKTAAPHTIFTATLNYQNRPDFNRIIQEVSLAYQWEGSPKISHYLLPMKISIVKIDIDSAFQSKLDAVNDQFLKNSYRDHFILGNQYSITYNNQDPNRPSKNSIYLKVGLEQSGNLVRKIYDWTGTPKDSIAKIFGIQFAQYIKTNIDFRFNQTFNRSSRMVYRLAGGFGYPQRNFNQALPFEKSFFSGGSNGMRGWKARTLGPGSFRPTALSFDKIGDIMLEGNLEYRFGLLGFLESALFVDAGNIWNIHPDPARPGSGFSTQFYTEIAMDAGLGFRFDLDFFIIRLDVAIPMKDPQLEQGERWIWQKKPISNQWFNDRGLADYRARFNLNLGINYPF